MLKSSKGNCFVFGALQNDLAQGEQHVLSQYLTSCLSQGKPFKVGTGTGSCFLNLPKNMA